ncbi:MAG: nuclear transport factor 2 family protein [Ottowia sp.]|nr:nuclear transport factor 2 family protein [Ottowia sp.]
MSKRASLFESAESVLEAYRDALRNCDVDTVFKLWLDDESVSCVLPNGIRLTGHVQLRTMLRELLEAQPMWFEVITTTQHSTFGVAIFEATEALHFSHEASSKADLFVHTTYVFLQNHEGWRIAHVHCSPAAGVTIEAQMQYAIH